MGVSENTWGYPKIGGLSGKTLLNWMIWGYPYFWKHPNVGKYTSPTDPLGGFLILRQDFSWSIFWMEDFGKILKDMDLRKFWMGWTFGRLWFWMEDLGKHLFVGGVKH